MLRVTLLLSCCCPGAASRVTYHSRSRILSWWKRIMMFIDLTYTTFYIPLTLVMWERYQITYSEEAR